MFKPQTDTSSELKVIPFDQKGQGVGTKTDIDYNEIKAQLFWYSYENLKLQYEEISKTLKATCNQLESICEQITATEERGSLMDWHEKYLDKLDKDIAEMKSSLRDTENRIAQMINQTLSEMRDRDNQRHQEFLAINTKLDQKVDSIEQKIDKVRNEIKEDRKWIIGIAITTIIGIAAMVITVFTALH